MLQVFFICTCRVMEYGASENVTPHLSRFMIGTKIPFKRVRWVLRVFDPSLCTFLFIEDQLGRILDYNILNVRSYKERF